MLRVQAPELLISIHAPVKGATTDAAHYGRVD